ncbi:MAG: tetratricopeptide repeat protein, partial [bacterium]|nr:tetratricopeptide repeat protein [bacterium]
MTLTVRSLTLLVLFLAGCAAQQPQIRIRPVEKPTPPPTQAINAFIAAKLAELKGDPDRAIHALTYAIQFDSTSATLYGALARNLNARHRFAEAVDPARRATEIDPGDPETRWHLYRGLIAGAKDTTEALQTLQAIIDMDRISPLQAHVQMLQIYASRRENVRVLQTLDLITALPNLETSQMMAAAENYKKFKAPQRAERIYKKLLVKNPELLDASLSLGDLEFERADTTAAEKTFRAALRGDHNQITRQNARIWGQLVRIYRWQSHLEGLLTEAPLDTSFVETMGQVFVDMAHDPNVTRKDKLVFYGCAESILDRLLKAGPEDEAYLSTKAQLLLETDRPAESRKFFNQVNALQEKAQYWLGISRTYMAEHNWDTAQKLLEDLHALAPPTSEYYPQIVTDLAQVYLIQGDIPSAREVYKQAADAIPDQPEYRYALARTYVNDQEWEDAIRLLDPLQNEMENRPDVLFDLGHSYERSGKIKSAETVFLRLLSLFPDHAGANNYLGYMLAERGDRLNEAIRYIQKAVSAEPQNGAYLDSLGWVYFQMGKYREAMEWLMKAIAIEEEALKQVQPGNERQLAALNENL